MTAKEISFIIVYTQGKKIVIKSVVFANHKGQMKIT